MPMFRKKPVVIEARQFTASESVIGILEWVNKGQSEKGRTYAYLNMHEMIIPTLEGDHTATIGDWIIKGVAGEFYPCKPEIFAATYEAAE